ncbi:MAG: hypothetical protein KAU38_02215 [Desulfobacterales bacterium]|nr:hypothetical protein [Desulfobacterales bacterium]
MKYNLELLKADIRDELEKIQRLEDEFANVEEKIKLTPEEISYYDRGAIGYLMHNFYNGCENIFRSIARFFENDLGPQTWHKDLLKRMKLEISGFRPRVIDEELYRLLDDFRAFRHRFRHLYAFELDWERERHVAGKFRQTTVILRSQITYFLKVLDQIESE